MQRFIATLLVLLVSAWAGMGCAIRGDGKNVAYVVDGASIVAGMAMIGSASQAPETRAFSQEDPTGLNTASSIVGKAMLGVLGTGFLVAGGIGMLTNMEVNKNWHDEKEKESDQIARSMVLSAYAPGYIDPKPIGPCTQIIAAWSAEKNHTTRYEVLKKMPHSCRREIVESM